MVQVTVNEGDDLERVLRRFKRQVQKAGIFTDLKRKKHYEKPSETRKHEDEKVADSLPVPAFSSGPSVGSTIRQSWGSYWRSARPPFVLLANRIAVVGGPASEAPRTAAGRTFTWLSNHEQQERLGDRAFDSA
jgi:small subunit ribosomal protein S21